MRGDRENGYFARVRAVAPEDAERSGCFVFSVGLENLLALRAGQAFRVFVGMQAGLAKVGFQESERFVHRTQTLGLAGIFGRKI